MFSHRLRSDFILYGSVPNAPEQGNKEKEEDRRYS